MDTLRMKKGRSRAVLIGFLGLFFGCIGIVKESQALNFSEVIVTDVSARSFTVNWQTQSGAEPNIEVYRDVLGTSLLEGTIITPHYTQSSDTSLSSMAQSNGVMRIRVSGLQADTAYFYRVISTSADGNNVDIFPSSGNALPSVKTKQHSLPFSNESLSFEVFQADGLNSATGSIVILDVEGSETPVSYMVGDGVETDIAALNLTNLFDSEMRLHRAITGGEPSTVRVMGGALGESFHNDSLPVNGLRGEIKFSSISPMSLGASRDSDGDGISDVYELAHGLNPNDANDALLDTDSDGLNNLEEYRNGTDSRVVDTDGDGLDDAREVAIGTLANQADSDRDGRIDGDEVDGSIVTNPLNADSDGDGVNDGFEVQELSNPNDANDIPFFDEDGDSISDSSDNCVSLANLNQSDNDNDGLGDICDIDDDNDGILDAVDNAPLNANSDQDDEDMDRVGDIIDNCLGIVNQDQADNDSDGLGDLCDSDDDNDGIDDFDILASALDVPHVFTHIESIIGSTIPAISANNINAGVGIYKAQLAADTPPILIGVFNLITRVYEPQTITEEQQAVAGVLSFSFDIFDCDCIDVRSGDSISLETSAGIVTAAFPALEAEAIIPETIYLASNDGSTFSGFFIGGPLANLVQNAQVILPLDNCQFVSNTNQSDVDNDGIGDACDVNSDDFDGDNIRNAEDNCPNVHNILQEDIDRDGIGDLCDTDNDNDGVSDENETTILGTDPRNADSDGDGILDGDEDFDFDGVSNRDEFNAQTNPEQVEISLVPGLNLFSYPMAMANDFTAFDLLELLGGNGVVERIERFDHTTQLWQVSEYVDGVASGVDFAILNGEGYHVYMQQARTLALSGHVVCNIINLRIGFNIVGIACPTPNATAFSLLESLGGPGFVTTVERFNTDTGLYDEASYLNNVATGVDFLLRRGEAYQVTMAREFTLVDFALTPIAFSLQSHRDGDTLFEQEQRFFGDINDPNATVTINGIPAAIISNGSGFQYEANITLAPGVNTVDIEIRAANNLTAMQHLSLIVVQQQLRGDNNDNALVGTSENDIISGRSGDDILYGLAGDDRISGDQGVDTLIGGVGNDILITGTYYHFDLGDGQDEIRSSDSNAVISFGPGITLDSLRFRQISRSDIEISYGDQGDSITIDNFIFFGQQVITRIEVESFELNAFDIRERLFTGTQNADQLFTTPFNDVVQSLEGDDRIRIHLGGNDTVDSGSGNDEITIVTGGAGFPSQGFVNVNTGAGNDEIDIEIDNVNLVVNAGVDNDSVRILGSDVDLTFTVEPGDAFDTVSLGNSSHNIQFLGGITARDIAVEIETITAISIYYGTNDVIRLNHRNIPSPQGVRYSLSEAILLGLVDVTLSFASGSVTLSDILRDTFVGNVSTSNDNIIVSETGVTTRGREGNDVITGTLGADRLEGGNGDDILIGRDGDDEFIGGQGDDRIIAAQGNTTYYYSPGDGQDSITYGGGVHRIIFGEGVLPSQVSVTNRRGTNSHDLIFNVNGFADAVSVMNYWNENAVWPNTTIELAVEFLSDPTTWGHDDLVAQINQPTNVSDKFYLYGSTGQSDELPYNLRGGAGDDIFVSKGDSVVNGSVFGYAAGDGRDIYDLALAEVALGINERISTFLYRGINMGNHWDLSSIDSSRASFSVDGPDLVITIDNDSSQALVIKHFFNPLTQFDNTIIQVLSDVIFSDRTFSYDDIVLLLTSPSSNGTFLLANQNLAPVIGSSFDDTILLSSFNSDNFVVDSGAGNDFIWDRAGTIEYIWRPNGGLNTVELTRQCFLPTDISVCTSSLSDSADSFQFLADDNSPLHISFVYNPMRYGTDYDVIEYGEEFGVYDDGAVRYRNSEILLPQYLLPSSNQVPEIFRVRSSRGTRITGVTRLFAHSHSDILVTQVDPDGGSAEYFPLIGVGPNRTESLSMAGRDFVTGGDADEYIETFGGIDTINSGAGNDFINGGGARDIIDAGDGDDIIIAGGENGSVGGGIGRGRVGGASITGGRGNDRIFLDLDSSDLHFSVGDGHDEIVLSEVVLSELSINTPERDAIYFASGIRAEDLQFSQRDSRLFIQYTQNDVITIRNYFENSNGSWQPFREVQVFVDGNTSSSFIIGDINTDNASPVAVNDNLGDILSTPTFIAVSQLTANDTDADNDSLVVYEVLNPVNGRVVFDQEFGRITFIPDANFIGQASFEYIVDDSRGGFATGVVQLTVTDSSSITGSLNDDRLEGSAQQDTIYGSVGRDEIHGRQGDDVLDGGVGQDTLHGGSGDDLIYYTQGDVVDGGEGFDTVISQDVSANIAVDDTFIFADISHVEVIDGGAGFNIIVADDQNNNYDLSLMLLVNIDQFYAGEGDDIIVGPELVSLDIYGDGGNDWLLGGNENDALYGGQGNDWLNGGAGADVLSGGTGIDSLFGGDGGDYLDGNRGANLLSGGNGNDVYYWQPGDGNLFIADYASTDAANFRHVDSLIILAGRINGVIRNPEYNDFIISRNNFDDLIMTLEASGESLVFYNWFKGGDYQLDTIVSSEAFDLVQLASDANANLVSVPTLSVPAGGSIADGEQIYNDTCVACHGIAGSGVGSSGENIIAISGNATSVPLEQLFNYVAYQMPVMVPENCVGLCAKNVSLYLQSLNLPQDSDNDGVSNNQDLCDATPDQESVDANGCATSQLDTDNDGVNDLVDACPTTPENESVNSDGCALIELDDDNDGVNNAIDICPNTLSQETANDVGCSASQIDSDGDGIADGVDACPDSLPGADVDIDGCELFLFPSIEILSPGFSAVAFVGEPVILEVQVTGATQSDVSENIEWFASRFDPFEGFSEVFLGTGARLTVSNLPIGENSILVRAFSLTDNTELFESLTVTVVDPNNTAPSISVDESLDGARVVLGDTVTLSAAVSDAEQDGLDTQINWFSSLLGGSIGFGNNFSYSFFSPGRHEITASVRDSGGLFAVQRFTVYVEPPGTSLPSISIDTPFEGEAFVEGNDISFNATASDSLGSNLDERISWTFLQNGSDRFLGSSTSVTDNFSAGIHTISASVSTTVPGEFRPIDLPNRDTVNIAVMPDALPQDLPFSQTLDVGGASVPGVLNYDAGRYIIDTLASDINGNTDRLFFAYQQHSGDIDIQVRISDNNTTGEGGLTIRSSLTPNSRHATMLNDGQSPRFIERGEDGSNIRLRGVSNFSTGEWLRLQKSGDVITAYTSVDGTDWIVMGTTSLALGNSFYVGMVGVKPLNPFVSAGAASIEFNNLSFTEDVTPVDSPPELTIVLPEANGSFLAGTDITFEASAIDNEDGDISEQVRWSTGANVELGTGRAITVNSLSAGEHVITASVSDSNSDSADAVESITITIVEPAVDQPPELTIILPEVGDSFIVGADITFEASAVDNEDGEISEQIRWSSVATSTGVNVELGTGATITVNSLPVGEHVITASVSDSNSASADAVQSITITVIEPAVDQPPELTIILPEANDSFIVGADITFEASAIDNEDGEISGQILWSSVATSTSVNVELGTGATITVNSLPVGEHVITARVSDSNSTSADAVQSITITIIEPAVDQPPELTIILPEANDSFIVGADITFEASAIDNEDGEISEQIRWSSAATAIGVNVELGTGATITVNSLPAGEHVITASVSDSNSASADAVQSITITVIEPAVDQLPVLTIVLPEINDSFIVGADITFEASAIDNEDGEISEQIRWSSVASSTGINVELGTGATITVNNLPIGEHVITARVDDSANNSDEAVVNITIIAEANTSDFSLDQSLDIGVPGSTPGSSLYDAALDRYELQTSAFDLGGNSDNFFFVYQEYSGDIDIRTQVSSINNGFAKGGLTIRANLAPQSRHATMTIEEQSGGVFIQRIADGAGTQYSSAAGGVDVGNWVRLQKVGNDITGFVSTDGNNWVQVTTMSLTLDATFYVGLAAVDSELLRTTTITFDQLNVIGDTAPPVSDSPPVINILQPISDTVIAVGDELTLTASAIDAEDGDISNGVVWSTSINDEPLGTGNNLLLTSLVEGVHTIIASITDSSLQTSTQTVTVTVNAPINQVPQITIIMPFDGDSFTFGSLVNLQASASDTEDGDVSNSITWISSLDNELGNLANLSLSSLSLGNHTLTAMAMDSNAETAIATVTINIVEPINTPPTLNITEPLEGTQITEGDALTLIASANDVEDGDISANITWVSDIDGGITEQGSPISISTLSVGTHIVTAQVIDSGGESVNDTLSITVLQDIPDPDVPGSSVISLTANGDIGSTTQAGSLIYDAATNHYTINSSSFDIGSFVDNFFYAYTPYQGDIDIRARVISVSNPFAKVGLMIRSSLENGSAHMSSVIELLSGGFAIVRNDDFTDTNYIPSPLAVDMGNWVRLEKVGTTINSYASVDGESWTLISSQVITIGQDFYIGIAAVNAEGATSTQFEVDSLELLSP